MAESPLHVTDTELAVLRTMWQRGTVTVREIAEDLYPSCSASDVATIHSLLKRLEAKGAVRRDRATHPHCFEAAVTESEVAGHKLEALADQLSGGSLAPFILHLLNSRKLSQAEADEIRTMLESYKPKKR
ncbi:MAG: BlaI/MecI/CopY family transcriptional regulator [Planctomycetaceae bacterium]|nr:BlaI/MecI/CopY family transcriptional regulator [Planctomycetales bacterium]MCB9924452.1 BlaI/MecI/CopY family transcriptional regulator [Planctomycetaceae bacterium]